ncbi:MAG: N-formylglutamate amidohydrolase, partial [Myxococcales bacterium]|nr:N-formylglutamate amidohydrolase [Myxococcales bacterium]
MLPTYTVPNIVPRHIRRPTWWLVGACSLLVACAPDLSPSGSQASSFRTTVNHTTYQSGDIPILITVPHGGSDAPANVDERTTTYDDFVTSSEAYLQDIAEGVAARLYNTHGITPYMVIGESDRLYIDYNRDEQILLGGGPANEAYEDTDANTYYDEYHSRIAGFVSTIQSSHGSGLLIDLHGTT